MCRYVKIQWPAQENERQLLGCCILFSQAGTGPSITPAWQVRPTLATLLRCRSIYLWKTPV